MRNGIDISYYQDGINYDDLKGKVDFVIIRIGRWLRNKSEPYIDSAFEKHYSELKKRNIPVGGYWYCYAETPERAATEAEWCYKWIKNKQFEYPIFFDIEEKSHEKRGNCDDICRAFLEPLEKKGYWVGIYSYNSFIEHNLSSGLKQRYSIWTARTPKADDGKTVVAPTSKCLIHQYTFKKPIGGFKEVDGDICNLDNIPEIMRQKGLNGFGENVEPPIDIPREEPKIPAVQKIYNVVIGEFDTKECAEARLDVAKGLYPDAKIKITTRVSNKG